MNGKIVALFVIISLATLMCSARPSKFNGGILSADKMAKMLDDMMREYEDEFQEEVKIQGKQHNYILCLIVYSYTL